MRVDAVMRAMCRWLLALGLVLAGAGARVLLRGGGGGILFARWWWWGW